MRGLLPLQRIVRTFCEALDLDTTRKSTLKSKVWEDNTSALIIEKIEPPCMTPGSKRNTTKYHWFREQIITSETLN